MNEPIDAVDVVSCRPDFAVLCYPGDLKAESKDEIRQGLRIPADTPPILPAHASDDGEHHGGSDAENSVLMYLALKRANVTAELHVYAQGAHGFGVRKSDLPCSSWPDRCIAWLRNLGMLGTDPRGAAVASPASLNLASSANDWTAVAPREEIRPQFQHAVSGGKSGHGGLIIRADEREGLHGWWQKTFNVAPGQHYRISAWRRTENVAVPRRSVLPVCFGAMMPERRSSGLGAW